MRERQLNLLASAGAATPAVAPAAKRLRKIDPHGHLPEQVEPVEFELLGAPRTKGNSRTIDLRAGRRLFLPSKQYQAWFRMVMHQVPFVRAQARFAGRFNRAVDVTATWFLERLAGDEDNYKKGLGDFLQRAGFISNDRLIHWTGECRRERDAARPRVVIRIAVAEAR